MMVRRNLSLSGTRGFLLLVISLAVAQLFARKAGQSAPAPAPNAFSETTASKLLHQITDGLGARNLNQVLGTFDLAKMRDGALFRQQMVSFIAQAENIRIHFHVTEASLNGGTGVATADVEMEADPRDSNNPLPIHKQDRLHFNAETTSSGWKFTDVRPRTFFSLQP
jgi:hypothetical protein